MQLLGIKHHCFAAFSEKERQSAVYALAELTDRVDQGLQLGRSPIHEHPETTVGPDRAWELQPDEVKAVIEQIIEGASNNGTGAPTKTERGDDTRAILRPAKRRIPGAGGDIRSEPYESRGRSDGASGPASRVERRDERNERDEREERDERDGRDDSCLIIVSRDDSLLVAEYPPLLGGTPRR